MNDTNGASKRPAAKDAKRRKAASTEPNAAVAPRGIAMRVSEELRDIIHQYQRSESHKQNRSLTVVEASVVVATIARKHA